MSKSCKKESKCVPKKVHAQKVEACKLKACDADIKDLKVGDLHAECMWTHQLCGNSPIVVMDTLNCTQDHNVDGDQNVKGCIRAKCINPQDGTLEVYGDLTVTGNVTFPVDPIVGVYNFEQSVVTPPGLPFNLPPLTVQGVAQFLADGSVIQMPTALLGLGLLPGQPAISGSHILGRWTKTGVNQYSIVATLVCVKTAQPSPQAPDNFSRSKLTYNLTLVPGASFTASGAQSEYALSDIGLLNPTVLFPNTNITALPFAFTAVKIA